MSEWNLWHSIDLILWMQRLLCVSPFYLDHTTDNLKISRFNKFYVFLIIFICLILMYYSYFHWNSLDYLLTLAPEGIIWPILCDMEFVTHNTCFVIIVLILYSGKAKQIRFLQQIHSIDEKLADNFHSNVNHKKYKKFLFIFISIFCFYYLRYLIISPYAVYNQGFTNAIPFVIIYYFQLMVSSAAMFMTINYLYLIASRYEIILCAYKSLESDYIADFKSSTMSKDSRETYYRKLKTVFDLFKEMSKLNELTNDFCGWIYVICTIKIFSSCLIHYFIIMMLSFNENLTRPEKQHRILFIWFMMFGDKVKIISMNFVVSNLKTKV